MHILSGDHKPKPARRLAELPAFAGEGSCFALSFAQEKEFCLCRFNDDPKGVWQQPNVPLPQPPFEPSFPWKISFLHNP